eukprot:scaffold6531_cov169-Ochromonas_danica.AAC.18
MINRPAIHASSEASALLEPIRRYHALHGIAKKDDEANLLEGLAWEKIAQGEGSAGGGEVVRGVVQD